MGWCCGSWTTPRTFPKTVAAAGETRNIARLAANHLDLRRRSAQRNRSLVVADNMNISTSGRLFVARKTGTTDRQTGPQEQRDVTSAIERGVDPTNCVRSNQELRDRRATLLGVAGTALCDLGRIRGK